MIKFPIATQPLEDESLMGFIARACDRNGHPDVRHMLNMGGYSTHRASFVARAGSANCKQLATLFGASEGDLLYRSHHGVEVEDGNGFVNFLGAPVRKHFREPILRRVSAASLRISAHHRAPWLLKPLHYCPESGDLLISRCPNCGHDLRWERTYGIEYCEYCVNSDAEPSTDLRKIEMSKINEQDLQIYSSVANYITKPATPEHAAFPGWKGWEIFDFVVLLAIVMAKRFGDRIGLRKTGVFELPDWHMNFMAAARAVLGWPDAFGEFIDQIRGEAQSRSGYFGRTKEVGQLAVDLRIRYGASRKMCDQIETAVEAFFASKGRANTRGSYEAIEASDSWTSFKDALKKHGDPRFLRSIIKHKDIDVLRVAGAKRSPVYFDKFQLELLMQARSRLLGLDRLPLLTGFPQSVLEGLNASNHVRIVDSHVARLRRPQVHPDEVEKLEGRIKANASPRREGQIPVLEALRISGTGNHLVHVIRAILDGEVRFSLLDQKGPVLSKIALLEEEICRVGRKYGEMQIELPDKMTARDAGIFLDVNADDIPGLIGLGCLKSAPPHRGRFVEGQSVQQFSTKLVSHCRAASWLRIDVRSVKSFMKKQGVNPFASYMTGNRTLSCVWRRTDLDALIKSR